MFVCFFGFFPLISLVFVTCSRDGKALERFLQDYFDGKLKRYLKSEAVPETNDGPVKVRDSWIGCLTMSTLFPLIARNGKYGFKKTNLLFKKNTNVKFLEMYSNSFVIMKNTVDNP